MTLPHIMMKASVVRLANIRSWPIAVLRVGVVHDWVPPNNGLQGDAPRAARA